MIWKGKLGPSVLVAILVALVTTMGAAAAGEADRFGASDDLQLEWAVDKSYPAAAEGLSSGLVELSSARLEDAGNREQAAAISLPATGAGSLQRDDGRLIVQARVKRTSPAVLDSLRAAGAEILFVSDRYLTVDLAVREERLRELASLGVVTSVIELLQPMVNRAPRAAAPEDSMQNIAAPCGSVISEGDLQMRAAEARSAFEVDGSGIKVGVVSDSHDTDPGAATRAAADVASGDLPGAGNPCGRTTPVEVLADLGEPGVIDEGRAMEQIVHDIAPGSPLAFATRGTSEQAMADNIRALSGAGSRVIVDDITFLAEPFYQDGPISVAVNEVTAAGRVFYSSAANSNVIVGGLNVGSFEAPSFRVIPGGSCVGQGVGCMDFNAGAVTDNCFEFRMDPGGFNAILQWAEPRNGVTTDLDFYLVDLTAGGVIDAASEQENTTTQLPFERIVVENTTGAPRNYCMAVNKFSGPANPRLKFILSRARQINAVEYPTPTGGGDVIGPSIFGHNGAANAVSTAAVPFDNSGVLESFSSYGPVTLTHGPVSGPAPAAALPAPQVLAKPDLAATDNNRTTFFLPSGPNEFRFSGTSAAAPHAAGVAALQLARNPNAGVAEVKQAQIATAVPVGALPATGTGAGLVNAVGAVGAIPAPPAALPPPVDPACEKAKKKVKKLKKKLKKLKKQGASLGKIEKAKKKLKKAKKKKRKACGSS